MMKKRALSLLMVFILCLSLLPLAALAAAEAPAAEEIVFEEESEAPAEAEESLEAEPSPTDEESSEPVPEIISEESEETAETAEAPAEDGTTVSSGSCGENTSWTLSDTGTLTVSGTGEISDYYFATDSSIKKLIIKSGITAIGQGAFQGCDNLAGVTIPDSVTDIRFWAFWECAALTAVSIPAGVSNIDYHAFGRCGKLTTLTVNSANKNYCSQDNVLYNKAKTELICCPGGKSSVSIPGTVTRISYGAFSGCSKLSTVTVPAGVKTIEADAFEYCSSLTSVSIPSTVTLIDANVFIGCSSLSSISVASANPNYTSRNGLLYNKNTTELICCPGGKSGSITLPGSVTNIQRDAFKDCGKLTSISVEASSETYSGQNGILYNKEKTTLIFCPGGKTSVSIPNTVTTIYFGAFSGCRKLTAITIPSSVKEIGARAFENCTGLSSVVIPNGVEQLDPNAFAYCTGLTRVTIPGSITSIANYTFYGCSNLASVTIGSGIETIKSYAFYYCSSLSSITLPDSVTAIETCAFDSCSKLTSLTLGSSVSKISYSAFAGCSALAHVYYKGSQTQWNSMDIRSYNDPLFSAAIHYNSRTVTYNANGGKGAPSAGHKSVGEAYTISTVKPTRAGYTFLGWAGSKTASKAAYLPGKSYTSMYLTLYAVWAKASTITFNANGGTGGPKTGTKTYGVAYTIPTAKPTRSGYTFLGWSNSKTATTAKYLPGKSYSSIYLTLYAVWAKASTITFNANGGTGGPKTGTKTYGVAYTIPTTKPTRSGYTFLGWSNVKNATTAKYLPGKSYSSIYLTLYAVWQKK